MTTPRSIRFERRVVERLASFASRHVGVSSSSAAALLVDEGLRMDEHPNVAFRDGPAGRRAAVMGGPDVWQVIQVVRSARQAHPELDETALLALVTDNTAVPLRQLRTAVAYWAAYPDEIDALLDHASQLEDGLLRAEERAAELLGR